MNYEIIFGIGNLLAVLLTGGLAAYFAWKSYKLEKNNCFHGMGDVSKMQTIDSKRNYLNISFLNCGNVEGYINEFFIELRYNSRKDRLKVLFNKKSKFIFILKLNEYFAPGVKQDSLPRIVEPRKRCGVFLDYKKFVDDMNELANESNARIKYFVFRDSTYNLYKFRFIKKYFPDLIC